MSSDVDSISQSRVEEIVTIWHRIQEALSRSLELWSTGSIRDPSQPRKDKSAGGEFEERKLTIKGGGISKVYVSWIYVQLTLIVMCRILKNSLKKIRI